MFNPRQYIIPDGLPSAAFFGTLERNSCVIIDDQFDEAVKDPNIRQAFKVDRRHSRFSIILITQSIFDNGKISKGRKSLELTQDFLCMSHCLLLMNFAVKVRH